jgi:nicotinamidase-related amidase
MSITTLDPNTALVVVDLQKGIAARTLVHPIGDVVARARELCGAFRARGLPVVLVNVTGGAPGRTERPPRTELDRQPSDIVVTKRTWGAFASTDLEARLRARGVTQVVVIGVSTGTGVESTARQAYEAGFHVTLPIDAMTDARPEAHAYSIANVFPRLGETGTTRDVLAKLEARR